MARYKTKNLDISFRNDIDIIEFNSHLLQHDFNDIIEIEQTHFKQKVVVNLETQTIILNNKQYLNLKEKLSNVRWINFRRNIIDFRMDGGKEHKVKFGIGFQGNLNGKNVKRILIINSYGEVNLETE